MKSKYIHFFSLPFILYRSKVWIGMKALGADSIILGTRKLRWIFPIKQIFDVTAAFLYWQGLKQVNFEDICSLKTLKKKYPKNWTNWNFFERLKSCRCIKYLLNLKSSSKCFGALNDWMGPQEFHAYLVLMSKQSALFWSKIRFKVNQWVYLIFVVFSTHFLKISELYYTFLGHP